MQRKVFLGFILLQLCLALAFGEASKTDRNAKRKANIQASKYSQKFNSFLEPDAKFDEFKPKRVLGQGSFGVVQLVEHKRDGKLYAMKTIELEKNGFVEFQTEVNALRSSTSQFIVPLIYSFWDEHWLYGHLVFQLVSGGDFSDFLNWRKRNGPMSEDEIRFYVANMVMSIQYLQNVQMIHRDLKPANFLFGDDGYLLLADFGLSRPLSRACRAKSFCGTMQYIAPEMIIAYYRNLPTDGYTQAVDWWAVGVMVLEMFTGRSPFKGNGENDLLNNIINQQIYIPKYLSRDAQDFIRRLLNRNPEQRLGYKSGREVKQHPFFKNLGWQQLNTKKIKSPYVPVIGSKEPSDRYRKNNS